MKSIMSSVIGLALGLSWAGAGQQTAQVRRGGQSERRAHEKLAAGRPAEFGSMYTRGYLIPGLRFALAAGGPQESNPPATVYQKFYANLTRLAELACITGQIPKMAGGEWTCGDDAGAGGGISNLVEDATPQLGGDLDPNGHNIGIVTPAELGYLHLVTAPIQAQIDGKAAVGHNHDAAYAPIAKGVTNGDQHNHSGGAGGQIAYESLSGRPTLGTAAPRDVGTGAGQVAAGDHNHDAAYAALTHAARHQNGGADEVATATPGANAIPKAGAGGTLAIGWIPTGQTGTTVALGNDARFSDARTPTVHAASHAAGQADAVTPAAIGAAASGHNHDAAYAALTHAARHQNGGADEVATATPGANAIPKAGAEGTLAIGWIPTGQTGTTVALGNDARFSDARTPTVHAASHAAGQADAVTPAAIGAAASGHDHAGTYLPLHGTADAAAALSGAFIDWTAGSGGASIRNKPSLGSIAAKNATAAGGKCAQWSADGSSLDSAAAACGSGSGGGGGTINLNIDAPSTVDSGKYQFSFPAAVTIGRVQCSTDTGTVSINLDVRAIATPNTAGTNVLSAPLVCDSNSHSSCASGCDVATITAESVAAHVPVDLQITATASSPNVVRIHVEAQ